ncbi:MAG: tripartite tricarboxylate transporter substrate binding protein [Polaromonas sp.]|nr:tripartite tricarboxylate transporter substrate binding protein [Polaromonas sp.]
MKTSNYFHSRFLAAAGASSFALAAVMSLGLVGTAAAETFPSKPVRLVVPFAAGGTMDVFGRLVAGEMSKAIGQNVIVENIPGAGGVIAATNVVRSAPDGYSVCFCANGSTVILPLMDPKLSYKVPQDLVPVGHVLRIEQTILANADKGPATLAALVAKAKAKPGGVFYGTPGNGTSNHLAGELFKIAAGIDVTTVHYKGESPSLIDLFAGQIDYIVASVSFADTHVKSGKLRILGLTGPSRLSTFPNVPTIAEQGYPGYEATTQVGLHVAKGTPRDRINKLNEALNTALKSKELQERMLASGVSPVGGTPESYTAFLAQDSDKWGKVIKQAGIKLE